MVRLSSLTLRTVNIFTEIHTVDMFKKSFPVSKLLVTHAELSLYYEVHTFSISWWILK